MKKYTLLIGIMIGALVFGLAAFAARPFAASAQAGATTTAAATSTDVPATTAPTSVAPTTVAPTTTAPVTTTVAPGSEGPDTDGPRGPGDETALVNAAASVTGLTAAEVTTQLQAGQSLAQIAISKGKTAADVIAAARTALSTQLQAAVTAGTITQAQSEAELAKFDQQAPQIVNQAGGPALGHGFGRGPRGPGGPGGPGDETALVNAAASVTGLTAAEVTTQLQAGQSLAQIAISKGKTAADVIAAARTALSTQLQAAVTAKTITQAQADAELAKFDADAPQIVNQAGGGEPGGMHGPKMGGNAEDALISATASVTGLTAQQVDTQLQAGQSLAQIATAKGKTADDVINAARTALTTQLQAAVTAKTITQAQSDASLAQFNQTAAQTVSSTTLGQESGEHGGH